MRSPFKALGLAFKHRKALSIAGQLIKNLRIGKLKTPEWRHYDGDIVGGTEYTGFKTGFKF